MHPVAQEIIQNIDPSVYEVVARRAMGDDSAVILGTPVWSEIPAPHNDRRTLAILRVEGSVRHQEGDSSWSSVVKLIDISVDAGRAAHWVNPDNEEAVYEGGLFQRCGLRFRPVRCYFVSRPSPDRKLFWLEDLTEARGTPFTIPELKVLARDIGTFNGHCAANPADLPFETATDSYFIRWQGAGFPERVAGVAAITDQDVLTRMHSRTPTSTVVELHQALDRLASETRGLPHTLAFGDCQPGNLFSTDNQTIAIDWASLTMDPTGVDAGCLIGSAMTWGKNCAEVAQYEREVFHEYLEGLVAGGWTGNPNEIRRGFFGQFSIYLMIICCASNALTGDAPDAAQDFLEKRFQTPLEDIPDLLVPIIDLAPKYLEEVKSLLD